METEPFKDPVQSKLSFKHAFCSGCNTITALLIKSSNSAHSRKVAARLENCAPQGRALPASRPLLKGRMC